MEFVIKIGQFLLSLSLLIVLHELGHFLPAKAFKTRVEKFYLFFDVKFSLFKKKIGETVYGIGWLPLGGYVKISGMIDESMDTEQMAQPVQPWEFRSKPAWQRLIIMLGGVTVNFILAYIIYVFLSFGYGDTDISTDSIQDGYLITNPILTDLGIKTGDDLVAINGEKVSSVSEIRSQIIAAETLTINSDGFTRDIALPEDFLGKLSTGGDKTFFDLRMPFIIAQVPDSSANATAGLQPKDAFLSLNGMPFKYVDQSKAVLKTLAGQDVEAEIVRDGSVITLPLHVNANATLGVIQGGSMKDYSDLGYFNIITKELSLIHI